MPCVRHVLSMTSVRRSTTETRAVDDSGKEYHCDPV